MPRWIRLKDAAAYMGMSKRTLERCWKTKPGLARAAARPTGRALVFEVSQLDAYMETRRVVWNHPGRRSPKP